MTADRISSESARAGNLGRVPFGPKLASQRVVLREATRSDVTARMTLGRDADIERMFGAAHPVSSPMTQVVAEQWIASLGRDGRIEWVVETEGRFLGIARLHSFNAASARYAVGFFDRARLGKGYGAEVTSLVLDYAFGELELEEVTLAVLAFNERAQRCYRGCGFREVGRVARAAVIDGEAFDDILMAVTAADRGQRE
jgi:[ribosomal protein S5]-alanine N-acetyltransferase